MQTLWFWLTSVMVAIYATMDGFDFGAGILHPFVAKTDRERRQVLAAIGPYWDGNEVWLLAGGGAMFVAFPKVLAAGFSGLYLAMFLVIWTLILRGIAIEFRSHVKLDLWRSFWDVVFFVASALMPIFLGAALGNIVRGVPLDDHGQFNLPLFTHFAPHNPVGILDWYTVLVGLFVWATIAAHGSRFLSWKTDGEVRLRCRKLALPLWCAATGLGVTATFATAQVNPDIYVNLLKAPLAWFGLVLFVAGMLAVFFAQPTGRDLAGIHRQQHFHRWHIGRHSGLGIPRHVALDNRFSMEPYRAQCFSEPRGLDSWREVVVSGFSLGGWLLFHRVSFASWQSPGRCRWRGVLIPQSPAEFALSGLLIKMNGTLE